MKRPYLETVQQSAQNILCCADDFAIIRQSVDDLYPIFSAITGVTIDHLNIDKDIVLPSGKAISTSAAAHCLLEMKRTAVFLRGSKISRSEEHTSELQSRQYL